MKELFEKYLKGICSPEELNQIFELMKANDINPQWDELMSSHWNNLSSQPAGDSEKFEHVLDRIHHEINLRPKKSNRARKVYLEISRVAAILLIPLLVFAGYWAFQNRPLEKYNEQTTLNVPLGAISQITLPDGTKVWLNSGSSITYPLTFRPNGPRLVSLNGEGYFQVKKNPKAPFIVDMARMDIKVTGTTFNVRSYNDEGYSTVALVEGSVQLGKEADKGMQFTLYDKLIPNEVATLDKENKRLEIVKRNDLDKYTAWREGRVVFDNDPIEIVIDKFEKLFNVNVIIKSQELNQYRFTATFVNETLERALKILSLSSPISYQIVEGNREPNGTFGKRTIFLKKLDNH